MRTLVPNHGSISVFEILISISIFRHCELKNHYLDYKILKYSPAKTEELLEELLTDFEEFGVPLNVTDDIRKQVLSSYQDTIDSKTPRFLVVRHSMLLSIHPREFITQKS